jgi:hypothetical protein
MRKILFVAGIMLLFMISASFAFELNVPTETISIPAGGTRDVMINITSSTNDNILFSFSDAKTWVSMDTQHMLINKSEMKFIKVSISPPPAIQLGLYKVGIVAESLNTNEKISKDLYMNIERGEKIYIENLMVTGKLEPMGYADIKATLKNYMKATVQDVSVHITAYSPTEKILDYTTTQNKIDPMEAVVVGKTLYFSKTAVSGTYNATVEINYVNGHEFSERTFNVVERSLITSTHENYPIFIGYGKTIKVRNDGNDVGNETVIEDISSFDSIFFSGSPTRKEGNRYFWEIPNINPGEERTITYKVDYSSLFIFILAVIIAWWYFFYKYRTLRIRKFIMQRKDIKEGEEFTIGIELHNGLGRSVKELTVRDFVPPIFKIREAAGPEPKKKTTNIGTELLWKLDDLKRGEERILSYKIIPVFGVHGALTLPTAYVEFTFNKMNVKNMSNITRLGVKETDEEKSKRFGILKKEK